MNKQNRLLSGVITFALMFLFLVPNNASAKRKPEWVKERPNDPAYYIGIAMSPKTGNSRDYVKKTRVEALKQMSSEIKVNVSSNSVLHRLEDLNGFRDEYEAEIHTSVEQTLEGYEVKTWENKKEYWVMVRLSKEKYKMMRLMKLDMAKSRAYSYYEDALKALDEYDVYTALNFLGKAVVNIKDHLEEDLTYRSVDGTINIGTAVYGKIQDIFHRIELEPLQKNYRVKLSKNKQLPIEVKATWYAENGQEIPLEGLPLNFSFSKGEGVLSSQSVTGPGGIAKTLISRLISKSKTQEIKCVLDISSVKQGIKEPEAEKVLDVFFPENMLPVTYISLELEKSSAYVEMEEIIFGEESSQQSLLSEIKTILNKSFFTFTGNKEDADFIVRLKSEIVPGEEKKGNGYSLFIVYADFKISIENAKTGTEVFSDGFTGIKGMRPGSYEHAIKDAMNNLIKKFNEDILSRLEQLDM
ncbi:MAG: hypothetical protein GXO47_06450 [Chlorobi bacterium]|nr:hypothetical protein [Chlorobiota bacterium]